MDSTNLHESAHNSNDEQPSLEDAAQRYAALPWYVIPCKRDKRPLTAHGQEDATTDSHQIEAWWTEHPEASIGVFCSKSGFFVLDVDPRHDGDAELAELFDTHGPLPRTVESATGGNGQHFFFKLPEGCTLKGKLGQCNGLDVKGNGYVILPPSSHPSGGTYRWVHAPWDVAIADAPPWLLDLLTQPAHASNGTGNGTVHDEFSEAKKAAILADLRQALPFIPADDYDTWLHVGMGIHSVDSGTEGFNAWREWSATCPEKFDAAVCTKKWRSFDDSGGKTHRTVFALAIQHGWKAHSSAPGHESTAPEAFTPTDTGNGQRLVVRHGKNIRYVHLWKKWLVWDDTRWTLDNSGAIYTLAKDTARAIATDEAKHNHDNKQFFALLKWSTQSMNAPKLKAMLELAQSEFGVPVQPEHLDTHPWLFNAQNGTLNLRGGYLRPHARADLLTKLAPITFDAEARCPQWEDFLEAIFNGNQELIDWLQKAIGYSLTGDTSEQCFFLLHGTGSNGKSTFLNTLKALFSDGQYYEQASFETFLRQDRDSIRNDLAKLKSCRLVAAIEADEGRRLSEVLVKTITGGDPVSARFLFSDYFTFTPAFKVWLATNHKPEIRGTDHAMWRRVRLIPFNVTIPDKEQDKGLLTKLQEELPGILAWAVRGCLAWQEEGLDPVPDCVKTATEEYRSEQDVLGGFLTERCILRTDLQCPSTDLFTAYQAWAEANGEGKLNQTAFASRLKERGLRNQRSTIGSKKMMWHGIGLNTEG